MDPAGCSQARRERLRAWFQLHSLIALRLNNPLLSQVWSLPLTDSIRHPRICLKRQEIVVLYSAPPVHSWQRRSVILSPTVSFSSWRIWNYLVVPCTEAAPRLCSSLSLLNLSSTPAMFQEEQTTFKRVGYHSQYKVTMVLCVFLFLIILNISITF